MGVRSDAHFQHLISFGLMVGPFFFYHPDLQSLNDCRFVSLVWELKF
jgi:hypothetical protein